MNLTAISPIDGRYRDSVIDLEPFFSEKSLIRYRLLVEIEYVIYLLEFIHTTNYASLKDLKVCFSLLREVYQETSFTLEEAHKVKAHEKITNHDVKAVEYYIKDKIDSLILSDPNWKLVKEFIHFGLTSQDINNVAVPLMIKNSLRVYLENLNSVLSDLDKFSKEWISVPMLAKTHGQPATPTSVGKEIYVFVYRIRIQLEQLGKVPISGKFGGATGQFNAHHAAFPCLDWIKFANSFLKTLGLEREQWTTQISNYDNLASLFENLKRINTILIDLCRDIWQYISMEYFKQKVISTEVGSSTMPHKVNPINFENAEGNLGIANAIFEFMASKLPISRLQRDLTDSTVLRNVGVPMSHTLIALKSIKNGLSKLVLNRLAINNDLEKNFVVVSEAIQTILRREGYPNPYEVVKKLIRTGDRVDKEDMKIFVENLDIPHYVKNEILYLSPFNYIGQYPPL